jgi:FkbH-like protein
MTAEIRTFSSIYLTRITQLANKTNQFNLTTKRYAVGEIESITENDEYVKIYGKLTDKYGANGLIALTIGRIQDCVCHIELWLMSCRVLKRDMEFAMLDEFVRLCKVQNVEKIIGYYYKSSKNSMVSSLYKQFGFSMVKVNGEDTIWELNIKDYVAKNKFIGVKND